jgi:hypothetical protein
VLPPAPLQVFGGMQAGPLLMKWPIPSQTMGCWPTQVVALGLQSLHFPVEALQVMHGSGSLIQAVPVLLHVCGVFPIQRFDPGWHMPVQLPPEQTLGQSVALAQCPIASQFCDWSGLDGEQRMSVPGWHSAQTPLLMHAGCDPVQAVPSFQLPLASHVWGTLALHRVLFGVQTPEHTPAPLHTNWQVVMLCHWPLASQVCEVVPLHCLLPGMQTPQMPAPTQSDAHAMSSWNLPSVPHVCGVLPLH